eukprot:TRINITY_DN32833_c0_g1_i1.p1 TRINITY_DN32833_c0_g1~~TRINITY_DN32833_c0_g1_i1.p1  ORF type:complete len:521 (+),score=136.58 TRINITY_DN32833_c0_g1_i1:69-1631(+)
MELADEDRRLVATGAVHLINHVLGLVIAQRHPRPVEEMARLLQEGALALPAPELWQFANDLDLRGAGAVALLEKVLRASSPKELDPNDPHFLTYLQTCWLVIAKMGDALQENSADARKAKKDRQGHLNLFTMAAFMRQGRQDLHRVAMYDGVMSTGTVHVVIDMGTCREVALPLTQVVRQLGWLFDGIAPYWQWEVTLIGDQEGTELDAIRDVFIIDGGNSKFHIECDPLENLFSDAPRRLRKMFVLSDAGEARSESHLDDAAGAMENDADAFDFTVLMDLSLSAPLSAIGTFIHDLAFDKGLYVAAARNPKGGAGRTGGPDAEVVKTLLRNLSSAPPPELPGCWSRLAVYRTSSLRAMHATSPFRCRTLLLTEIYARAVTREAQLNDAQRQAVEKKPRQVLVSLKPVPHLPCTGGFGSLFDTDVLDMEREWDALARSLASDQQRKNAVFQKFFIMCTDHKKFVAFVNETRALRAQSPPEESDLSASVSMCRSEPPDDASQAGLGESASSLSLSALPNGS